SLRVALLQTHHSRMIGRVATVVAAAGSGVNVQELRIRPQRLADGGTRAPKRGEARERLAETGCYGCGRVNIRSQQRWAIFGEVTRIDRLVREHPRLQAVSQASVVRDLR